MAATASQTHNDTLEPDGNLSLLRLLDLTLRHRWLVAGLTLGVATLVILWAALRPMPWTAQSRFMPTTPSRSEAAGLAGLAGRFGIDISGIDNGESLEFYAELVRSPDLLRSLALTEFEVAREGGRSKARLVDILGVKGDTEKERLSAAIHLLQDQLVVPSLNKQAGLVKISTIGQTEAVAAGMNRRLLDLVAEFNLEKRQSQAGQERQFAEARLADSKKELEAAEAELRRFSERNRQVQSPHLLLEQARLERQVNNIQEVYTSLIQAYEQARINEVRNTPVLTVIEQPEGIVERADRKLPLFVVAGLLLGLVTAITVVLAMNSLDMAAATQQRYPEVGRLYGQLRRRGSQNKPVAG